MRKEMKSVGLGEAILVPEPAATVIGPAVVRRGRARLRHFFPEKAL